MRISPSFQPFIVGVDEVGRGCFAGPVVAAAASFSKAHEPIGSITDSKKLTAKMRFSLDKQIRAQALEFAIGEASVEEINTLGIVPATFLAMERALLQMKVLDEVIVDGSLKPRFQTLKIKNLQTLVKGDQLSYAVAAASIIAKVYRDELMTQLHQEHPHFEWAKNKGYGTLTHRTAITQFGLTCHHRTLFCRNIVASMSSR